MGAPRVTLAELDFTTRVPSFPGVSIGMVIPAAKGDVDQATLVTNETDFLTKLTANETVPVGADLAHYSAIAALAGTNRLWVARAHNAALYGGIVLASNAPAWAGSTAYALGDRVLPTSPDGFVYEATVAGTSAGSEPAFPATIDGTVVDGTVTWTCVSARAGNFAIPIGYTDISNDYDFGASASAWGASTSYTVGDKVIPVASPNGFYYQATVGGTSGSSEPSWPTAIGGTVADGGVTWTCEGTLDDDATLIYQSSPGGWGTNIGIKVFTNATSPSTVKTADGIFIQIFRGSTQVEPGSGSNGFLVSRVTGKKDGFGQGIFVEDRLLASNYIRALSNTSVENTTSVLEQTTTLVMTSGTDGSAVTDTQMIAAAAQLSNAAQFVLTLLIDGGWATAAFGTELNRIAALRGDCMAILSVPLASEQASDFTTSITTYRNSTLNLNSSWSALYTPHVQIRDKFNDRDLFVAPDGYIASIISKTGSNFDLWLPPAGFDDRVQLPVVDTVQRFTEGQLDILSDNEVNPILFEPGEGISPNDQKTQLSAPSALQEINVRLLLLVIEPALKLAMKSFLFKQNTPSTRALAQTRIEGFLEGIKNAPIPGINQFRVQVNAENNPASGDPGTMNVWVFIEPTRAVREIPITIILTNPGAELSLGT